MFDDQNPQGKTSAPGNLPLGEPEDIFGTMPEAQPAPAPRQEMSTPKQMAPASALSAGALRPRMALPPPPAPPIAAPVSVPRMPSVITSPPPLVDEGTIPPVSSGYPARGPAVSRVLMILVVVVLAVGVLGGGGWYVYRVLGGGKPANAPSAVNSPAPVQPVVEQPTAPQAITEVTPSGTSSTPTRDEKVLFGGPVDSDGDGLSDYDEVNMYHTDPHNWDTDGDGLSDYDEVMIWHTDPKNSDSDSDTYSDGVEVKNGFNPNGPGKIFEPPKQ